MKVLLDTNICIYFFRGKFEIDRKIDSVGILNCFISEITLAELVYGAESSSNPSKNHQLIDGLVSQIGIVSIFEAIAEYGKQKAKLRKSGIMISDFDLLIGCTAIANDFTVVTQNTREFQRLDNIKLLNWTE